MGDVLDEVVSTEDLQKFEQKYNNELSKGDVTKETQFEYAWCLVRSKYPSDIRKGIVLLQDLYTKYADGRRDYLYYLTIGSGRIKQYMQALQYCREFLKIEPANQQVQSLETTIKKRLEREGKIGMGYAAAGVMLIGGLVGLGVALSRK